MNKQRKSLINSNEVSKVVEYNLGGYPQKVMLDGKSAGSPILLSLHGGPAMPIPFSVGCRGMFPEFTEHFILVCWDQLGCGINDYTIDDSFSIDCFVDMTVDLIRELKKEFPSNKLIIFGTSWGSILAVKAANRIGELVDNVIVMGQIVKDLFFNDEVYETLEQAKLSKKSRIAFKGLQERSSHTPEDMKIIAALIRRYTQGYQAKEDEKTPMGKIIVGLLTSPDYSFKDFVAMMINGFSKNQSIWRELLKLDISAELMRVNVPYLVLQGDMDIVTSTKDISLFVEQCGNPNLSLHFIKNCGHLPGKGAMDEILAKSIKLL